MKLGHSMCLIFMSSIINEGYSRILSEWKTTKFPYVPYLERKTTKFPYVLYLEQKTTRFPNVPYLSVDMDREQGTFTY